MNSCDKAIERQISDWLKNSKELLDVTDGRELNKIHPTSTEANEAVKIIIDNVHLPAMVKYKISGLLRGIACGEYSVGTGKTIALHEKIIDEVIKVDPTFFDGVNITTGAE